MSLKDEKEFWEKVNERLYCSEKTITELERRLDNPILGDNIPEDARYEPGLKQQISEFKEEIKIGNEIFAGHWNKLEKHEEVLRDFFEAFDKKHGSHFSEKLGGEKPSEDKEFERLLEEAGIIKKPSEPVELSSGVKIIKIIEVYDNGHENAFFDIKKYFRKIKEKEPTEKEDGNE